MDLFSRPDDVVTIGTDSFFSDCWFDGKELKV